MLSMDFSKFINYKLEDFLNDDTFVAFVIKQDENELIFWDTFKEQHPSRKKVAEAAFQTILTYRRQKTFYNENAQAAIFNRISETIATQKIPAKVFKLSWFVKVAAVFAILFLSAVVYFNFYNKETQKTDFGKVKTIVLPDGSTVTLNGNSKITYAKSFGAGPREVWITGEALFDVKHLNIDTTNITPAERFIVHCSDMNIEVLGTSFNVKDRRDKISVGLLSGKIRISYKDVIEKENKLLVMAPGDFVKYKEGQNPSREKIQDPEILTAWVNHQLIFKNATIEEMAQVLEDDFGYEVKLQNPEQKKLRIEGEINVGRVNDLLRILSNTLHINIKTQNKTITIND